MPLKKILLTAAASIASDEWRWRGAGDALNQTCAGLHRIPPAGRSLAKASSRLPFSRCSEQSSASGYTAEFPPPRAKRYCQLWAVSKTELEKGKPPMQNQTRRNSWTRFAFRGLAPNHRIISRRKHRRTQATDPFAPSPESFFHEYYGYASLVRSTHPTSQVATLPARAKALSGLKSISASGTIPFYRTHGAAGLSGDDRATRHSHNMAW
jgi:hypothetical protein